MYAIIGAIVAIIVLATSVLAIDIYDSARNKKKSTNALEQNANEIETYNIDEMIAQVNEQTNKKLSFREKKTLQLKQARISMSFEDYLLITVFAMVGVGVFMNFMIGSTILAVLSSFVGLLFPEMVVSIAANKSKQNFETAFIKALKNMSSVIKSGGNLKQAVENVTRTFTLPESIREDFKNILIELQFGSTIEDGFFNLYQQTQNTNVLNLAIALQVQKETGGNLTYMFETIAKNISQKQIMNAKNRALMAEAKLSATVIAALPFILVSIIKLIYPYYYTSFQATLVGKITMCICFVLIFIGIIVTNKVANIDID